LLDKKGLETDERKEHNQLYSIKSLQKNESKIRNYGIRNKETENVFPVVRSFVVGRVQMFP
jgi:hypothetical protein